MNLKTWLSAERGRYAALAAHLGVTPGRVTQIADNGVPTKFMFVVRAFTGGAVSLESMVSERTPVTDRTEFQPEFDGAGGDGNE